VPRDIGSVFREQRRGLGEQRRGLWEQHCRAPG